MDLGATVCTPDRPLCGRCPVADACVAHRTRRVDEIPARGSRRRQQRIRETALVIRHGASVLVERRGAGEWWEGLWDFPRIAATAGRRLGTVHYTVTHHAIECVVRERALARKKKPSRGQRWVAVAALGSLAMSSPGRKIAALARER
jgi:A/G-specific adenine glycosylase